MCILKKTPWDGDVEKEGVSTQSPQGSHEPHYGDESRITKRTDLFPVLPPCIITGTLRPDLGEQTHLKVHWSSEKSSLGHTEKQNWIKGSPLVQLTHLMGSRLPYFGLLPRGAPAIED